MELKEIGQQAVRLLFTESKSLSPAQVEVAGAQVPLPHILLCTQPSLALEIQF